MISKEILEQVRKIEIYTRKLVNTYISGGYHSVFKGQGLDFFEVREYIPGDDIRHMAWNVTARFGKPFVKRFIEERELTIILAVDLSASLLYGSVNQLKRERCAEFSAAIALSALKNNDRVGCVLFTDDIELYIPPAKGKKHILHIIRELLFFQPESKKTNYLPALKFLYNVLNRSSVIFFVSDFLDDLNPSKKPLKVLSKKHDVIAVYINDPGEEKLPDVGLIELFDLETSSSIIINTKNKKLNDKYENYIKKLYNQREKFFSSLEIETIPIKTNSSYLLPLLKFFRNRELRRR